MKITFTLSFFLLSLISCKSEQDIAKDFDYKKSALGTLKEVYKTDLDDKRNFDARVYHLRKHKDEVIKNIEVVEEIEVQKDVVLIFYRYSIGTDVVKRTTYMKKIDGLYLPYSKYFSSYDEDPFENGKGEEGKALLKKADDWGDNKNIWWTY